MTDLQRSGLKKQLSELEKRRAELKSKAKNHRNITVKELGTMVDDMNMVNSRINEINKELTNAPKGEQERGIKMNNKNEINEDNFRDSSKYRDAFYRSIRSGKIAAGDAEIMEHGKRAITDMNGLSVTAGAGYVLPKTTSEKVYSTLIKWGKVYAAVTKLEFQGDVVLPIGTAGAVANEVDGTDTLTFSFTDVSVNQMAIIGTVTIKNLLFKNSVKAFEVYLGMEIGKYIGLQLENYVLNGDPTTSTFTGIIKAIKDLALENTYVSMDYDKIVDIQASVGDNEDNVWIMKRATFFSQFKRMQTADGLPLVTLAIVRGPGESKYLIDGEPILFSRQMPDTESLVYGDLSQYIVNESQSIVIETSTDTEFAADKVVLRGKVYSGGVPMFVGDTFKYYKKV